MIDCIIPAFASVAQQDIISGSVDLKGVLKFYASIDLKSQMLHKQFLVLKKVHL